MRTHHLLQGLAALALVACASWFAFAKEAEPPPPPSGNDAAAEAAFEPGEAAIADAAARDLDTEDPMAQESAREEIERAPDEIPVEGEADEGPVVTVLRIDETGKPAPVPGIEVAWIGVREGDLRANELPTYEMRPRGSEQPHRFGRKSKTGEDGTIRLPPLTESTWVAAAQDNLFAIVQLNPGKQSAHLLLGKDETLVVRVVDDQERGVAAAPLVIQRWIPDQGFEEKWSGLTDRRGDCVIRHFQFVRSPQTKGDRYAIAVTAPQQKPSWLEFQAHPTPQEPLKLTLSGTRQLAVRVVHKSGAPILASLHVSLWSQRAQADANAWRGLLPETFEKLAQRKPRGSDPIAFAHAGYGTKLQPFLHITGERAPRRLPEITLPQKDAAPADGSAFVVTLTLPEDLVVLAMQPHSPEGTPLLSADIPWQLRKQLAPGLSGNLETIADGRADFVVPSLLQEKDGKRIPETLDPSPLVLMLRETLAPDLVLGAEKALGALQPGERRDLGPIVMAPLPLLCKGRVTNDRGEPRQGAQVFLALALSGPQGDAWIDAPHLSKATAEDGTFAFYAPTPQHPFRVQVRQDNEHFEAVSAPLSPGARVELVTMRMGILQGRVIPPAGLPDNALTLTLTRDPSELANESGPDRVMVRSQPRNERANEQTRRARRTAQTPIRRKNGWFWLGNLEPGTYSATVTMRGLAAPLATFDGVRIAPGPNEDPRLSPLDLSQALFRYSLRAIGPGGQPMTSIEGPLLWRNRAPDGSQQFTAFRWQGGTATFFLPVPFAELVVVGPGIRATEVAVTPATRDVVVDPIVPFLVELPGVRSLAGPTRAIRVSAVFVGETGLPQGIGGQDQQKGEGFSFPRNQLGKSGGGWLDAADRTGLVVSRSGQYELTLRLYEGEAREGRQAAVSLGNHEVDVDGRATRPLVLPVDPQQVQRALESMQPRPDQQGQRPRGENRRR